jgi:uncharacterized protein YcfJ
MTEPVIETETVTTDGAERRETLHKDYEPGVRHGDEEVGGAFLGGAAGAVAGAIAGGPVGAVVGGAIGAAAGATGGQSTRRQRTPPSSSPTKCSARSSFRVEPDSAGHRLRDGPDSRAHRRGGP